MRWRLAVFYQSIEGWFDFDDLYRLAVRRCGSKLARFVEIRAYKGAPPVILAERVREAGMDIHST
jgi:hypothetical protein